MDKYFKELHITKILRTKFFSIICLVTVNFCYNSQLQRLEMFHIILVFQN